MRVLFISNFYPPKHRGGYEEWCQEIAARFVDAGHPIRVLTSTFQSERMADDPPYVYRQLNLEMEMASLANGLKFFTHRKRRLQQSLDVLAQHIAEFRPDAVLCWGMWNFPFDIPALAENLLPGRVAYYLGDYWPSLPPQFKNYWEAAPGSWLTSLPKRILTIPAKAILKNEERVTPKFSHGLFCSRFLKDNLESRGIWFKNSQIVYGAIDAQPYLDLVKENSIVDRPIQLLSISRLIADKGIKTIVLALAQLKHRHKIDDVRLNIVGSGNPVYEAELRLLVAENQLEGLVHFVGNVPKSDIPALYQAADIFLFASVWPEPFGRVIIEAMASGVAVVGTAVGGAAEILADGQNALTFQVESENDLADKLAMLIQNPEMRQRLAAQAKQDAAEKFDVIRMFSEIEAYLQAMCQERTVESL